MYVCICNAVTDGQITTALKSGCEDVAELTQRLGVGTCCGSCLPTAEELVESVRGAKLTHAPQAQDGSDLFYSA